MKRWLLLALLLSGAAQADTPQPYVESYYDQGFLVFVRAGNLMRARQVAENALYWQPADVRWWERLAQVSRWQGDSQGALRAWRKVAEISNAPRAWEKVLELAPLTYDNELALRAHKEALRGSPRDEDIIQSISRQYELLGRADDGLAFFENWHQRFPGRAVLLEMQRLALNQGEDAAAARYSREYMNRFGPQPQMALDTSRLYWVLGRRGMALSGLRADAEQLPYDEQISRQLAVMAAEEGEWALAMSQYQLLLDNGDEALYDLYNYLALARYYDKPKVVSLMDKVWQRAGNSQFALGVLYALNEQGDLQGVDNFLAGLSDEQWQQLRQEAAFLQFYGQYYLQKGKVEKARYWLGEALAMAPDNREVRVAWLWLLISLADDAGVRETLARWEARHRGDPRFWPVLAAARMALGDAEGALRYERRLLSREPQQWQRQWQYAQALIAAGREAQAWTVLKTLHAQLPIKDVAPQDQDSYRYMQLALATRFEGADQARQLAQRIAADPDIEHRIRAEWLAQWAIAYDNPELARSWYLRKYLMQGELRAGSALAYALLHNDVDRVAAVQANYRGELTHPEKLEADVRLDQQRRAAQTLKDMQQGAPELAGRNNLQESLLLPVSQSSRLEWDQRRLGPLDIEHWQFVQYQPVSDYGELSVQFDQRSFGTNNASLLDVNEDERRLGAFWTSRRQRYRYQGFLGARSLFDNQELMAQFQFEGSPSRDWYASWQYQWRMPADESSLLMLGGSRTGNRFALNWLPSSTWQNSMDISDYDYRDLNDQQLGSGRILNLQSSWRPWLSRFSPGLKLRHTRADFTARRESMGEIRALLPGGQSALAIPEDYHETEVALLLGMPDVHIRPHRLQGWAELGFNHNSLSGNGFTGRAGIEGPLIGRDAWKLYLERQLNTGGSNEDSYRLGLQYRIYY